MRQLQDLLKLGLRSILKVSATTQALSEEKKMYMCKEIHKDVFFFSFIFTKNFAVFFKLMQLFHSF